MLKAGNLNEAGLKQTITLFQAIMYGVGLILGAGVYVLIGDVASVAGNAMWLSFIIAAAIAAFTGFSYAELSSMFPKSAAEYVFVKNAFQNNLLAFVAGWLITFVAIASAAAVAIGFSGYMSVFFPQFDPLLSATALIVALSVVNFIGIRESIWMNTTLTIIELAGLAVVVVAAVLLGSFMETDYYQLPPAASISFSLATGALLTAAGLAFFAYFGFENLANIADETKDASRTIPRALMISVAVTTSIYILIALSTAALVGWETLSSTDAPLALATEKAFGKAGAFVLSTIALFATSNTVLMMLVAASRIMFGMSREHSLPTILALVHPTRKTPAASVVLTMLLTLIVVIVSHGSIAAVANAAVFVIFIVYAMVNLSLIWIRYRNPGLERPFKSPLKLGWFPVLAGLGFATSVVMLTQFDRITMIIGAGAIAASLASYACVAKFTIKRNRRNDCI